MDGPFREDPEAPAIDTAALPRRVPWGLRARILLRARGPGYSCQIAWLALVLGLGGLALHPPYDRGLDRTVEGRVIQRSRASASSARRRNDPTYEIEVAFPPESGGYTTVTLYGEEALVVGSRVTVRYRHGDPSHALVEGLRPRVVADADTLDTLKALVGLGGITLLIVTLFTWPRLRLLRHGLAARGKVVKRTQGWNEGQRGAARSMWTFIFEFVAADGKAHQCSVSTFEPEVLDEERRHVILYHPAHPEDGTTLAHLPGSPVVHLDGTVESRGGGAVAFILPVIAAVCSVIAAVRWLGVL
jgi:hypothetical protein